MYRGLLQRCLVVGMVAMGVALGALGPAFVAEAKAPKPLTLADFFAISNPSQGSRVTYNDSSRKITGISYAPSLEIDLTYGHTGFITLNSQALPGYNAITFVSGFNDSDVSDGAKAKLSVYRDGALYKTFMVQQGVPAAPDAVPFDGHTIIKLVATWIQGGRADLLLANPQAVTLSGSTPAPSQPPAGAQASNPTLMLAFPSIGMGGEQTALITTKPNAYVTLVVTYPSGAPLVTLPTRAGSDGHYTYSWHVPRGVHGVVPVVVVSGGVAQGSFTIGA